MTTTKTQTQISNEVTSVPVSDQVRRAEALAKASLTRPPEPQVTDRPTA